MNHTKHKRKAADIIFIADRNKYSGDMATSAQLALEDAVSLFNKGLFIYSVNRALESLRYSAGVFSLDYRRAKHVIVDWNSEIDGFYPSEK